MKKPGAIQSTAIATVLAIGFGLAWGFGLGAVGSLLSPLVESNVLQDYETLLLDDFGTPIIKVRFGDDYDNHVLRNLDGERISMKEFHSNGRWAKLFAPYRPAGIKEDPITWSSRIVEISLRGNPPVIWRLIRDAQRPGSAYFVGYQVGINHCIGYLGRKGLRSSVPDIAERFDVGLDSFNWASNRATSTGMLVLSGGRLDYDLIDSRPGKFRSSQIFLCDGETVREIDLVKREVHAVKEYKRLMGVSVSSVVLSDSTDGGISEEGKIRVEDRLLLRFPQHLIMLNTFDSSEVAYRLPAGFEDATFTVDTVSGSDRLILFYDNGYWERGRVIDLLTINTSGEIEDRKSIRLLGGAPAQESRLFKTLAGAGLVPSLLPWSVGSLAIQPLLDIQLRKADTYLQGVRLDWPDYWPVLLIVLLIGIALAAIAYRWQQRYARPRTGLWTTLVFLFGLPGFAAYWLMHPRPPVEACPNCTREVPRNRDCCPACAQPFPAPALKGTEVFA